MRGLVIKCTGSSYIVRTDDGVCQECKVKGSFRIKGIKSTNPVAVGDYVVFNPAQGDNPSYIVDIEERKNYIIRRSSNLSKQSHILACNLDQSLLIVTINYPETFTVFIDRFLASACAYNIKVILVFNKIDLLSSAENDKVDELCSLYERIGYDCIKCDSLHGVGMEELKRRLKDKVTLVSGNSGVGKSTLINTLIPDISLKTGEISIKHNTGIHTTTFSEMHKLPEGGWVIDTPGIKGFGNFDMKEEEISHYFTEIFSVSKKCRFANCTHTNEPECAVKNAIDTGEINISRYASYLSMLSDENEEKYRKPE